MQDHYGFSALKVAYDTSLAWPDRFLLFRLPKEFMEN